MYARRPTFAVAVLLILLGLSSGLAVAGPPRLVIVRIAATPAEAARLVQLGVDLVEARDGADVFALVDETQWRGLEAAGWDVRFHQSVTERGAAPAATFPPGYRTLAEVEGLLAEWNTAYSD